MSKLFLEIAHGVSRFFEKPHFNAGYVETDEEYSEHLINVQPSASDLDAQAQTLFKHMPLFSVIMLTDGYDRDLIERSLKSVYSQSYHNVEVCLSYSSRRLIANVSSELVKCIPAEGSPAEIVQSVVSAANGEFLLLLSPGDVLSPDAVFRLASAINELGDPIDLIYSDEDQMIGNKRSHPFLKPDFSPDTLTSYNYIGRLLAVKTELYEYCGGLSGISAADEYDFVMRAAFCAARVVHIPFVLYTRYNSPVVPDRQRTRIIAEANIRRFRNNGAYAVSGIYEGSVRAHYPIPKRSDVSIIVICNGDLDELRRCLESIEDNSTYEHKQIIIADTGRNDSRLSRYFSALKNSRAADIRHFSPQAGYSLICNKCAETVSSRALLFMQSNIEVLSADWIESMLELALCEGTGAVGAKIVTGSNRIVSAGYVVGLQGWWNSPYFGEQDNCANLRMNRYINTIRNVSAVSGDCMMVSADVFNSVNGFDESMAHGGDVEFCLRLMRKRYVNVFTPYARVRSQESTPKVFALDNNENMRCYDMCRELLLGGDPNYNNAYDYSVCVPKVAAQPYPAIELNPRFK